MNTKQKQILEAIKIEFQDVDMGFKCKTKTLELLEIKEAIEWFLEQRFPIKDQVDLIQNRYQISINVLNYRIFLKKHFEVKYEEFKNKNGFVKKEKEQVMNRRSDDNKVKEVSKTNDSVKANSSMNDKFKSVNASHNEDKTEVVKKDIKFENNLEEIGVKPTIFQSFKKTAD